jgi:ATP-dependent protease ClpP protease subunit
MIKKIDVISINQSMLEEIQAAHTELKSSKDDLKELHLNLDSASGEKEVAVEAAQILHSDTSIKPVTNVTGDLDVSATILTAAGFEGRRTADPKSTFIINDGQPYGKDSKPADLEGLDYYVYDALAKITGRKFTIFQKMLDGGPFSSVVAKKCGIIDEITGFRSVFRPQKPRKGKGKKKVSTSVSSTDSSVQTDNSEVKVESTTPKTVIRTRKAPEKTVTTDGAQRGRIRNNS